MCAHARITSLNAVSRVTLKLSFLMVFCKDLVIRISLGYNTKRVRGFAQILDCCDQECNYRLIKRFDNQTDIVKPGCLREREPGFFV